MKIRLDDLGRSPETMSSAALVAHHVAVAEKLEQIAVWAHAVDSEIVRRLEMDGATEFPSNTHMASLTRSTSYDYSIIAGIFEFVPLSDLISSGAYKPAHFEYRWVLAAWNMTKVNTFKKRGKDIRDLIERARKYGRPRLKVKAL